MTGHRSRAAAVVASAALTAILAVGAGGCGGGSHGGFASTAAGATIGSALSIVLTSPHDGETDVDPTPIIHITFDADLDAASIHSGAVTLLHDQGAVPTIERLIGPRVLEVLPTTPLATTTAHALRITTRITGAQGERLAQDEVVRFTTQMARAPVPTSTTGGPGSGAYVAGAAAVDMTPAIGVPLAGFGAPPRRLRFPDLNPFNDHTFLAPSVGVHDPIMVKALYLSNGSEEVAVVSIDAVAVDARVLETAVRKAAALGFTVPLENVLMTASHTHSGPGAMSKRLFWQLTAADLYVERVFQRATDQIAEALARAQTTARSARIGVGRELVRNATRNRREGDSPDLLPDSIDPELLVVRVDDRSGAPIATVWNIPIHGTCMGMGNHEFSNDIMGSANAKAEATGDVGVALFMNGAEGDIAPVGGYDAGGQVLADAIRRARSSATTTTGGFLGSVHEKIDLGSATIDWTPQRQGPTGSHIGTSGFLGAIHNLGIGIGAGIVIPQGWMETEFRFQAIRIDRTVIASLPGEPIHLLGLAIKQDGHGLGYDHVMVAGLANGHGAYFTTEREYWYGGYEALASFFGPTNGARLVDAQRRLMTRMRP